jgi:hypothetical protein
MQTTSRTNHVDESFVFPSLFVPGVLYIITVVYRQSTPSWEKKKEKRIKLMSFASSPIIDKCQSSLPPKESRFNSAVGLSLGDFVYLKTVPFQLFCMWQVKKTMGQKRTVFRRGGGGQCEILFLEFCSGIWQRDTWRTITRPSLFITPQQNTRNGTYDYYYYTVEQEQESADILWEWPIEVEVLDRTATRM